MKPEEDYLAINRNSWNKQTAVHLASEFYDVPGFLNGKNTLNEIEMNLLGDLQGKSILHLQCHFGMDTLSLARLGATVTGVDLSDAAIDSAKELASQTNLIARFICSDVYDLPNHLDEQFDLVFTTYGTIGWLPDIDKWAKVVSHFLKPGSQFVFAEFHPVVWMFDNDFKKVEYKYSKDEAIIETVSGTYAQRDAEEEFQHVSWNHGLAEVLNSLIQNGIQIKDFQEYDYSPYDCFSGTIEFEKGKFRIEKLGNKIPMVYSVLGEKIGL